MTGGYLLNIKERKRFSEMPQASHHERVRALSPILNFDE